jgi:hypothetical protein
MYIDFERLKAERSMDPFAYPPVDILESVEFTACVLRDKSLANEEIMKSKDVALSRVVATDITARMRQLLAIMGWAPLDPATDGKWILDEPVSFPPQANALVAGFTAKYYAEGMSLLFSPDDGMFAGEGWRLSGNGEGATKASRAEVKIMAERRWVSLAISGKFCPASVLHHWVGKDVARINPARLRCDMAELSCPSISTIQSWCREFAKTHARRPGILADWRNYRSR